MSTLCNITCFAEYYSKTNFYENFAMLQMFVVHIFVKYLSKCLKKAFFVCTGSAMPKDRKEVMKLQPLFWTS